MVNIFVTFSVEQANEHFLLLGLCLPAQICSGIKYQKTLLIIFILRKI